MSENVPHDLQPLDLIHDKVVTVEIGVGHAPGRSVLDRLTNTTDIGEGRVIHVSLDEVQANLAHINIGSVSHMSMAEFAASDFLDGKVSVMYIFNVFGEGYSTASISGFSENILSGLHKKLAHKGCILVGEHITPHAARFMHNIPGLKSLGFQPELYDSPIAIGAILEKRGFSPPYIQQFIGQGEENKHWRGKDHGAFLLILTKD